MRNFVLLAVVIVAHSAWAQDVRVTGSGADAANYPPPRHFDHLHMRLVIDIPDMEARALSAEQTLTVTPIGRARSELVLNADGMKIQSVMRTDGRSRRAARFEHADGVLRIAVEPALRLGETAEFVTSYTLENPRPAGGIIGGGLTWTRGKLSASDETSKFAQIHSQGQPEFNRKWFPCHDFPNERLTTELIVTVEDPFVVSSNGRLVGTRLGSPAASGKPRMTWHWLQDKPHANYLVTLVVGRFSIVGLPGGTPEENAVVNYLYAPVGTEENAAKVYSATPAMMSYFSTLLDLPYPWDKYSQALCRGYQGGMENTSATTMSESSARARPGSQDDIIAHELIHQWFGDYLTCKTWEHAWLNEGWASYGEAMWAEGAAAPGRARRDYQRKMAQFIRTQGGMNRTSAPAAPAMVSRYYASPFANFIKANDIYSKGACVLHMLRMQLGDDVFWPAVRAYVKRHALGSVETDDFRYCLEEFSGQSLERFFTQWCYRPGLPRLAVEMEWSPAEEEKPDGAGELTVTFKQTQRINADNPAYVLDLPVEIKVGDGLERRTVRMDSMQAELKVRLAAKPADVTVDPEMSVVAPTSIRKPLTMWIEQARHSSLLAQIQAAEHLREFDDPAAAETLLVLARGEEVELRDAALASLEALQVRTTALVSGGAR